MIAGRLPDEGPVRLGPVTLPPGRLVTSGYGARETVAWVTIDRLSKPDSGRVWDELSAAHSETGLVPILLDSLDGDGERPWDEGDFAGPTDIASLNALDPATVLEELWTWQLPSVEEETEVPDFIQARSPFTRDFPGPATAEHTPLPAARRQSELDSLWPARIGLVAADRPADVLLSLGWLGNANWGRKFPFQMAAVLRSWEDRFGARLLSVGVGSAEISLFVDRPPRSFEHAQRLAAEHFVFCDECAGQGLRDIPSITASLVEAPIWTFWWD